MLRVVIRCLNILLVVNLVASARTVSVLKLTFVGISRVQKATTAEMDYACLLLGFVIMMGIVMKDICVKRIIYVSCMWRRGHVMR
jgi:hypothetical protein